MTKIILASENNIKENVVKKWFKKYIQKDILLLKKVKINDKLLPPQPINTGGILSCNDRIKYIINNIDTLENYNYIISIENSIKIIDNKIIDCVNIKIKNLLTTNEYSYSGGDIEISYKILKEYPKIINVIDDLIRNYEETNKKYIFDGCSKTFGELINKYYPDIPHDNWMINIYNKNRSDQILSVLKKLTPKIKADINNN